MAEYIEREAAKLRIFEYGVRHRDNSSISFACENLERQMNSIPAADVRPVVRCRDCIHYKPQQKSARWSSTTPFCSRSATIKMPPDGFCSFGEKREES